MRFFGVPPVYLQANGPGHWDQPFIDTRFVLAQLECWRLGIDVYAWNPCDPIGRLQAYSPLWLRLDFLPASQRAGTLLGFALDILFVASLLLLPAARLRTSDQLVMVLSVVSTSTIFAMERGNIDLLVFALCALAGWLISRSFIARLVGYAVVLAAAALKFYPLVVLIVAMRERVRALLAVGAAAAALIVVFAWRYGTETERALAIANTEQTYFGSSWGAASLPYGAARFAVLAAPDFMAQHPSAHYALNVIVPPLLLAGFMALAVCLATRLALQQGLGDAINALPVRISVSLAIGAALAAGCFLAHQNVGYRAIVLVLELPGLLALAELAPPPCRRLLQLDFGSTLFLLWNTPWLLPSTSLLGWLLRHCIWWAHITMSLAILIRLGLSSPGWRLLCHTTIRGELLPSRHGWHLHMSSKGARRED